MIQHMKHNEIPYHIWEEAITEIDPDAVFNTDVSLVEMGLDDLDSIELVLLIETKLDVSISDDEWEIVENAKNFHFIKKVMRDQKLKKIGI